MRQIICEEKDCYLEPSSQVGSGAEGITYMAGEQDGLTPSEATYMVPIKQSAGGQSARKLRRKRKSTIQVGGKKPRVVKQRKKKKKETKRLGGNWRAKQLGSSKKKKKVSRRGRKRS